jgi:hypothetical protein
MAETDANPEQPLTTGQVPTGLEPPDDAPQTAGEDQVVSWTASEFVAHEKSAGWYGGLIIAALLLSALVFLITRDAVSVGVVIVAALLLSVYAAHQPRQLEYRIDRRGIAIGSKYRTYDEFKSFSIVPEGAFSSIVFIPLKRFGPALTIYYDPADEEKILAVLANQLPFDQARRDMVDSLMRRIRF